MNKVIALIVLCASIGAVAANDGPKPTTGVAPFGPNETQSQACALALSLAKQKALKDQFGELIAQKSVLECDATIQATTGNDCDIFETTWSSINSNGFIKNHTDKKQTIEFSDEHQSNVCKVSAHFEIEEFEGKPDRTFETQISLINGKTLRVIDSPVIKVSSNTAAFHYVYYWAPNIEKENFYLLFPNPHDSQSEPVDELTVPSTNASKDYDLEVSLPSGLATSNEYLIVYSSKKRIDNPPEKISQLGLFGWLKGIDRESWTEDKISYKIIGDST